VDYCAEPAPGKVDCRFYAKGRTDLTGVPQAEFEQSLTDPRSAGLRRFSCCRRPSDPAVRCSEGSVRPGEQKNRRIEAPVRG
jgi:hypothetical protein